MVFTDLGVGATSATADESHLIERQLRLHVDGERTGNDLEVKFSLVAGRNVVELVAVIGDDTREDVEPTRRAARIGSRPEICGEAQLLDQGDEIGPVSFEDRAVAEIELAHREIA